MRKSILSFILIIALMIYPICQIIICVQSKYIASADTSDGVSVLSDLNSGSVDKALENVSKAEQELASFYSAENIQKEIAKRIKNIESGKSSFREAFRNVYFAGDSLMNGLEVYNILNSSHLFTQVSASLSHLEANLDTIIGIRPPILILHYGLNMLGTQDVHAQNFVNKYTKIVKQLKSELPGTRIIISLLFPVDTSKATGARFKSISKYNDLLIKMCKEQKIEYLNSNKTVKANSDCYAKDGIHLAKRFYSQWLKFIMKEKEIY
ncbi:MAG: GDSL-type esterase/lipase family protein [Faecalibacterium sp.]|nr:GDSL-type esterase/lipase family protein [Ruminococcus sp.]MCM1392194.1 GDSL-type esterase/lipase family protein [Ruminococcus sp.]MCM1485396.1 GDSL-type esterase/lipase family protein [Faecalibacterium sp.]